MIKCLNCGSTQPEGALFCSECGISIQEMSRRPTNVLPFSRGAQLSRLRPLEGHKLVSSSQPQKITFVIPGNRQKLDVEFVNQMRIGRGDEGLDTQPELDLTSYGGMEMGVSRMHAMIQLTDQGFIISDLGSTNGTYLNNNQLTPSLPFLIKSGDEIRFGDFLVHIFWDE